MKFLILLIFATVASGIEIGCRYSYYTYVGTVINQVFTCNVATMDFSDNSTHITRANGTEAYLEATRILYFGWPTYTRCDQFNLSFVPAGILDVFPNMIGLIFDDCAIVGLNGDELVQYPDLEYWMINYSWIGRIPGNFFEPTPNMTFVNFWANGITRVGDGLLDGLDNLFNVKFYNNICISMAADGSAAIALLIEALQIQCPDVDPTTTVPTTTQPPRCEIDDFVDFVCRHDEEIEDLKNTVEDLQNQINELKESNEELRELLREFLSSEKTLKPMKEKVNVEIYEQEEGEEVETIFTEDRTYKVVPFKST